MVVKNTIIRKEIYYFNFRLASEYFYRKSLRTDSPSKARKLIAKIMQFIKKDINVGKSEIDKFIEDLVSGKVNQIVRLSNAFVEPLSPVSKQYFNNWFAATDKARYHNYNVDQHGGNKIDIEPYNNWLSGQLTKALQNNPLYNLYHKYDPEEGCITPNEDVPYYDELFYPTKHQGYYNHLYGIVVNYASKIVKAATIDDTRTIRAEITELKQQFAEFLPTPAPKVTEEIVEQSTAPTFAEALPLFFKSDDSNGENAEERGLNFMPVSLQIYQ